MGANYVRTAPLHYLCYELLHMCMVTAMEISSVVIDDYCYDDWDTFLCCHSV